MFSIRPTRRSTTRNERGEEDEAAHKSASRSNGTRPLGDQANPASPAANPVLRRKKNDGCPSLPVFFTVFLPVFPRHRAGVSLSAERRSDFLSLSLSAFPPQAPRRVANRRPKCPRHPTPALQPGSARRRAGGVTTKSARLADFGVVVLRSRDNGRHRRSRSVIIQCFAGGD